MSLSVVVPAIGAVAAIVTVAIHLRDRRWKVVSYILSLQGTLDALGGLHVVGGQRILGARHLLVFAFRNDGNVEVRPGDFTQPLRISFPGAKLIDYGIASTVRGRKIEVEPMAEGGGMSIKPFLLNAGEGFAVIAELEGEPGDTSLEHHVAGVAFEDHSTSESLGGSEIAAFINGQHRRLTGRRLRRGRRGRR